MHGLVNKSLQCFVEDTYGSARWRNALRHAGLAEAHFEPMLTYDDVLTDKVLEGVLAVLNKDANDFLTDLGTYLVSSPSQEALRRLMRFSGSNFVEFLHALDDLKGRVSLAVPDLEFPSLELRQYSPTEFLLQCRWRRDYATPVMLGVLRAMADDYGALAYFEIEGQGPTAAIRINLLDGRFSEGRNFDLGAGAA